MSDKHISELEVIKNTSLASLTTLRIGPDLCRLIKCNDTKQIINTLVSIYDPIILISGGSNVVIANELVFKKKV